jgi:VanZ family protein
MTVRFLAWSLVFVIIVFSVVPPHLRPVTGAPHDVEHFAIFWLAGLAFGANSQRRVGLPLIFLILFCGAIELAQLFVPGRHATFRDFLVDAAASSLGVITLFLTTKILRTISLARRIPS